MFDFENDLNSIILNRSSWRTYRPKSLRLDEKEEIEAFFVPISSKVPFKNKIKFKIIDLDETDRIIKKKFGTYGFISGARSFIIAIVEKSLTCSIDVGYALELIILKATDLGFGTCWLGGTFKRSLLKRYLNLNENEKIPAITPVGVPKSRNFKGSLIRFFARAKKRKNWNELFFLNTFNNPLSTYNSTPLEKAFEWVNVAPSGGNKQPWRILWIKDRNLAHFYIDRKGLKPFHGYWFIQYLDIGIAMSHFELACEFSKLNGKWLQFSEEKTRIKEINPDLEYIITWKFIEPIL